MSIRLSYAVLTRTFGYYLRGDTILLRRELATRELHNMSFNTVNTWSKDMINRIIIWIWNFDRVIWNSTIWSRGFDREIWSLGFVKTFWS